MALLMMAAPLPAAGQAASPPEPPPDAPAETEHAVAARDAEGRGLFEAGRAAFTDGRYEDALDYFDRAYALTHRSELLYNIGSANDRLRRDAEALIAFEEFVRVLPDAPNVREVEARIRVLRESIAAEGPAPTVDPTQAERDQAAFDAHARESEAPPPSDGGLGVAGEWWFWTLIVAVAAGAIVTGVVLGTQGTDTVYPPYMTGDNGAFVFTLTVAP